MSMPRPHHGAMDAVVGIACPCLITTRKFGSHSHVKGGEPLPLPMM